MPPQYIYLHGFASGPASFKARRFQAHFSPLGCTLQIPDLNAGDFRGLTMSRQLAQVAELVADRPTVIIGSSLGGLTAALLAERLPNIQRLVLLAPAFGFSSHWLPTFEPEELQAWKETGVRSLFHYGDDCDRELSYEFITDLQQEQHDAYRLSRSVPTLILHGTHDEVIPIEASRRYARDRAWVELTELDSDHSLANCCHLSITQSFEFLMRSLDA